ncbi:hypothetical protein PHLCEN_2v8253 [Hermanssonia centrifuga]|uniref:Homeobox domain-containing protein n=1 Tax=Hermanssonia centrifuga TaxID=98765 RepID=A0A2R6NU64_9APHY|nr:hypothetical protein PHLCEN_2v8253 [Hermanssonia centrifuga]
MLSTSSLMSRTLAASSSKPTHTPQIPLTRRRLQPEQIQALQTLYELKSHPSKEERAALARELNL